MVILPSKPFRMHKIVKNDDFCAFWRILKAKWPFCAPPTPRSPKSYQEMLFPCSYGINTYNLGQKPRKWVKNSEKSLILMIFDHLTLPGPVQRAGTLLGETKFKIFIKITKLGPQGSISSNYIVLQSPWPPKTYNFIEYFTRIIHQIKGANSLQVSEVN